MYFGGTSPEHQSCPNSQIMSAQQREKGVTLSKRGCGKNPWRKRSVVDGGNQEEKLRTLALSI